jgi:hypothetical protein
MDKEDAVLPAEEYDHSVPKASGVGLAILASLVFLGGGQLVKGHYRRFFTMWGVLATTVVAVPLAVSLLRPEANTAAIAGGTAGIAYGLIWIYQLWDAAVRV